MEQLPEIHYLSFNQDQSCLAVGTSEGFMIFGTDSFALRHHERCGAVSLLDMLFTTSLLALVGGAGTREPAPDRRLTMWNTKERCNICQMTFSSKIHSVKMNHRRVVVQLRQKTHILDLKTMRSLHVIDRVASPWVDPAISWLCAASERGYLAMPLALNLDADAPPDGVAGDEARLGLVTLIDSYTLKHVGTVFAHRSPVQALCMNATGQLLATASSIGTVVRVFHAPSLDMLHTFRRGASACRIFSLVFSRDSTHICASAASGTVHLFKNSGKALSALPLDTQAATIGAARSALLQDAGAADAKPQVADPVEEKGVDGEASEDDEWTIVDERPDFLQLSESPPSFAFDRDGMERALQSLSVASGHARKSTTKVAKSLLRKLPQPCREFVEAPRAFAWAHAFDGVDNGNPLAQHRGLKDADAASRLPTLPTVDALKYAVLGALQNTGAPTHGYVACLSASSTRGSPELLVATAQGCARLFDWDAELGGLCCLRTEHSFMSMCLARDVDAPARAPYTGAGVASGVFGSALGAESLDSAGGARIILRDEGGAVST